MKFGAHVSASGGLWNAPINAAAIGCEAFQFFTRPPQGGNAPKLDDATIAKFRAACETGGFDTYVIHAPYIINLASVEARIRDGSIRIIREELERGSMLGAKAVMFHPGSARDVDLEVGIRMVADGMKKILDGYKGACRLLVEISAGSGNVIGDTFDEVAAILKGVGDDNVGVCFDTAHAFASGYDLRDKASVDATLMAFDDQVGLERLVMSHCNDSKVELGAKKDRHDHLGEGHIGLDGFKALVGHPKLQDFLWIVETPIERQANDLKVLKVLREGV